MKVKWQKKKKDNTCSRLWDILSNIEMSLHLILTLPYKHSTCDPLVGHQRLAATGWLTDPHPLGGSGVGCKEGCRQTAGSRPPLSLPFHPHARLCAYWCSASLVLGANNQPQATLCQAQWHRVGFQPSIMGWIVVAGLLCADPPHDYQRSASAPLDVNRWLSLPPLCRHSPLGGQLHAAKKCL